MKLPVRSYEPDQGRFLEFDSEREVILLLGPEGDRLHAVTWEAVVQLIAVTAQKRDGSDSRRAPRAALALKITYSPPGGGQYVTVTRDIGAGGVFIETATPLPRGTEVAVEFALPDPPFDRVVAKGRVAWSRASAERDVFLPGMGLQFTEIAGDLQRKLADLVTRVEETRRAA